MHTGSYLKLRIFGTDMENQIHFEKSRQFRIRAEKKTLLYVHWKSKIIPPIFRVMKKSSSVSSSPKVSFATEMKVTVENAFSFSFLVVWLEARWEFRRLSWLYHPFLWLISVEGEELRSRGLASVCIQHFWWQKQATSPIYRETCAWHFLHTFSLQHQIYQRQKSSELY